MFGFSAVGGEKSHMFGITHKKFSFAMAKWTYTTCYCKCLSAFGSSFEEDIDSPANWCDSEEPRYSCFPSD